MSDMLAMFALTQHTDGNLQHRERKPRLQRGRDAINTFKCKLFHGVMERFLALFRRNFLVVYLQHHQKI